MVSGETSRFLQLVKVLLGCFRVARCCQQQEAAPPTPQFLAAVLLLCRVLVVFPLRSFGLTTSPLSLCPPSSI